MTKVSAILLSFFLFGFASGQTAKQVNFVVSQTLVKTTAANGKKVEEFVAQPKTVMAGDQMREEVSVTNVSGATLSRILVSVPVPDITEFAGQATPANAYWKLQYSVDGGKIYSGKPTRAVTVSENGKTVTKQVTAPQNVYTNVRWTVTNLQPDESLKFSFRVKVK